MAFIPLLPTFRRPTTRPHLTMTQTTPPIFAPGVLTLENEGAYAVMAAAKALEQQTGRDVIHLEIGQPGFDTPAHVRDAGIEAINAGKTKYSSPRGILSLRAVIADWARRNRALECSEENIVVGPGAKPGLFFATLALVRDFRDQVIIPDPGFPTYRAMVSVAGGTAVPVKLRQDMRSFDMKAFRAAVNHDTRLVVINSPGNPTGGVIPLEDLIEIAALSRKYDFWVISDEIYSQLCYEDSYTSIASLPGMDERTVVVDGFSKSYCMTGWRLGWAIMPKALAERVELLLVHSVGCTATFVQEAGVAALVGQDGVTELREEYRRRRDIVVEGLNAIDGIKCETPQGAFYAFADVREYGRSADVAKFLLEEGFVATLAGTDFGDGGEGFIRLSYVSEEDALREGLRRIDEALRKMTALNKIERILTMPASPPHPASEQTFEDPSDPHQRTAFPSVTSPATIDLSVVVPAYNEQIRLPQMLDEALNYLQSRASQPSNPSFTYELIIVDDGSSDGTAKVAMQYVTNYGANNVRLLRMLKNVGKGGAVRQGVLSTRGRYVLMADADAATVFSDIEKLEAVVSTGVDVAIGSRSHLKGVKEGRGIIRGFISTVFNFVVVYVGGVKGLKDTQCGFKLYSRQAARVAFGSQMLRRWAFDVENLYRVQRVGMQVVEVPVQWTEVPGSKLSVVKATINMMCDMLRMRFRYLTGAWTIATSPMVTE